MDSTIGTEGEGGSGSGLDVCKEIMDICCDGLSSKEVAQRLNISIHIVEIHKNNIFKTMNINTTAEMVKLALEKHIMKI
jgi:DNA-binding CsgD family transcriptional regulator